MLAKYFSVKCLSTVTGKSAKFHNKIRNILLKKFGNETGFFCPCVLVFLFFCRNYLVISNSHMIW